MTLSAYEESALVKIQSAARGKVAREELKRLEADEKEEREWRIALSKRRERIERLERELQHVEEMPAAAVDTYSQTARYGRNNKDAAARAIQGIFRYTESSQTAPKFSTLPATVNPATAPSRDPTEGSQRVSREEFRARLDRRMSSTRCECRKSI